jgi:toxin ParE1/3/4
LVIWSEPAKKSLQQIYYFIAEDSKYFAKEVIEKIISDSEKLNDFPKLGKKVFEIDDDKIRELLIYSYRLIYEIEKNNINILALVHSKMNFKGEL